MGLRAVAEKALDAAFNAAGDAKTEVIYRTKTQGVYNAATDTQNETTNDTTLSVIYEFKNKDNSSGDTNVDINFSGTISAIIRSKELLPNTPKTEDLIVDGSKIYKVKGIEPIGSFSEAVGYTLTLVKDSG